MPLMQMTVMVMVMVVVNMMIFFLFLVPFLALLGRVGRVGRRSGRTEIDRERLVLAVAGVGHDATVVAAATIHRERVERRR